MRGAAEVSGAWIPVGRGLDPGGVWREPVTRASPRSLVGEANPELVAHAVHGLHDPHGGGERELGRFAGPGGQAARRLGGLVAQALVLDVGHRVVPVDHIAVAVVQADPGREVERPADVQPAFRSADRCGAGRRGEHRGVQDTERAGRAGDRDGLLAVHAAVGQGAGRGDRGERAEREVGEGDRVDREVEQGATGQLGARQPLGAAGVEALAVVGEDGGDLADEAVAATAWAMTS